MRGMNKAIYKKQRAIINLVDLLLNESFSAEQKKILLQIRYNAEDVMDLVEIKNE